MSRYDVRISRQRVNKPTEIIELILDDKRIFSCMSNTYLIDALTISRESK